jgi:hypothetical protein
MATTAISPPQKNDAAILERFMSGTPLKDSVSIDTAIVQGVMSIVHVSPSPCVAAFTSSICSPHAHVRDI